MASLLRAFQHVERVIFILVTPRLRGAHTSTGAFNATALPRAREAIFIATLHGNYVLYICIHNMLVYIFILYMKVNIHTHIKKKPAAMILSL